jgi:uncharacterized protein DUF1579
MKPEHPSCNRPFSRALAVFQSPGQPAIPDEYCPAGGTILQREETHAMQKTKWGIGCALLAAALVIVGTPARADDKKNDFEAYEKAGRPGPQHKVLASLAGSWEFTSQMWMAPGQAPQEWKGTAERKMILGGRFLEEKVTATFLGQPFHGFGLNGYDNAQGKFVGTWLDSMSTAMSTSVGTADASGKVITYERDEYDVMARAKTKSRDVLRIVSPDKEVLEFYKLLPGGKEFKMMEIVYTRKRANTAK